MRNIYLSTWPNGGRISNRMGDTMIIDFPNKEIGLLRIAGLTYPQLTTKPIHDTGPSPSNIYCERVYDAYDEEFKILLIDLIDDLLAEVDDFSRAYVRWDREKCLESKIKTYDSLIKFGDVRTRYGDLLEKYDA